MKRLLLLTVATFAVTVFAKAQVVAIKTNFLENAALTPNLGLELGLGRKYTLDMRAGYSDVSFWQSVFPDKDKQLVNATGSAELRYWFCGKFNSHFLGVHALYSRYDVKGLDIPLLFDRDHRFDGTAYGGGVSWGYHWMWSKRWGLEFNLGAGFAILNYDKYDCGTCDLVGRFQKTYFGPTRAGITLVLLLK